MTSIELSSIIRHFIQNSLENAFMEIYSRYRREDTWMLQTKVNESDPTIRKIAHVRKSLGYNKKLLWIFIQTRILFMWYNFYFVLISSFGQNFLYVIICIPGKTTVVQGIYTHHLPINATIFIKNSLNRTSS